MTRKYLRDALSLHPLNYFLNNRQQNRSCCNQQNTCRCLYLFLFSGKKHHEPRHKQHYRGTDCRTEIGINPFDSNQQYGYYFCPCNPFTKEYKCQKNGKHGTGFINGYNLIDITFLKGMKTTVPPLSGLLLPHPNLFS